MAGSQDYEDVVKTRPERRIAQFDDDRKAGCWAGSRTRCTSIRPSCLSSFSSWRSALFGLLLGQRFFSAGTLTLILQQVQIVGILAAAQTLVILTAGIDLSVGALAVLCIGHHGAVHLPLRHCLRS